MRTEGFTQPAERLKFQIPNLKFQIQNWNSEAGYLFSIFCAQSALARYGVNRTSMVVRASTGCPSLVPGWNVQSLRTVSRAVRPSSG